ncbi:hypothetical protein GALMADRAFT_222935 [Galerina marginata CBS 339.88]|uniref:Uncharacterized protein n=1 Tax=Galerina marginata (strain CBS 339.88) TaxID=685588 RepID=A0A067TA77_GALM3|nr:hypothetical protein GALMADRAFT_222935 [Galerina marginata CBS 339.88]
MSVTLGNTKGAGFLGCVLGSILFGVSLVQVYLYYVQYPKDWLFQKVVVRIPGLRRSYHYLLLCVKVALLLYQSILLFLSHILTFVFRALDTTHTAVAIYTVYFYVVEVVEHLSVRHSVVWSIKVSLAVPFIFDHLSDDYAGSRAI